MNEIYRGDIVYISKTKFNRAYGDEMYSERPALVVSNDKCNHYSGCIEIVYLTSNPKTALPTHVPILCKVPSTALCENVYTVDKTRVTSFLRQATDAEMEKIDKALLISLALENNTVMDDSSLAVERDLYKKLYEDLLNKVVNG